MNPEVQQILNEMGITPLDFQVIQTAPSFKEAQRLLEALKDKAKAGFKRLAFEYHPDRTGNDPAKTAKFKLAATVKDDVEKLQVNPPRPVMQVPFIQVIQIVYSQAQPFQRPTQTRTQTHRPNSWAATTMHPNGVGGGRGR